MHRSLVLAAALVALALAALPATAGANHAWGNYHWARTSNPFTVKLGDNTGAQWKSSLATAAGDWSVSGVLDTTVVPGLTTPKRCAPTTGRVEVCSNSYGNNGWLGLAQIWASGDHITQGVVKLNDTYFDMPAYDTAAWRNLVACQEIGHTFGLDHQDEAFDNPNLDTCMDYTSAPETNQHPNAHDYEQLKLMYAHLDTTNTVLDEPPARAGKRQPRGAPSEWGRLISTSRDGRSAVYELGLGGGEKMITFVTWVEGR